MAKKLSKLNIEDAATIDVINENKLTSSAQFDIAKEKISNLKNDAAETAECLSTINSRIAEYLLKMEKLKKLEL